MLGKQMNRAQSFSMVHAAVLVAALGAASFMSPAIQTAYVETPQVETPQEVSQADAGQGGFVMMRATLIKIWNCDGSAKDVDV